MAHLRVTQGAVGTSSAVSSVLYHRGDAHSTQETKNGSYIYNGDASNFHEWEFRTRLRVAGKTDHFYTEAVSKVVEGLRGDAFIVAQEVGLDILFEAPSTESVRLQPAEEEEEADIDVFTISADNQPVITIKKGGLDPLIKKMKESVFPLTTHEAKELFRQYCKPSGTLSRQSGESMQGYISRRKRCWKLLKELDPAIELSEGHRSDMLLDLSGLDRNKRVMIQASVNNSRDFEKIAEALVIQHPRCHVRESRRAPPTGREGKGNRRPFGKGKSRGGKGGKGKFGKRPAYRTAYLGTQLTWGDDYDYENPQEEEPSAYLGTEEWEEPYNEPAHDSEEEENAAYWAEEAEGDEPDEEVRDGVSDPVEATELHSIAFLADCYC